MELKQQPQAIEAEKAVLGAILLERNAFEKASELLTSKMFYLPAHKTIFEAICELAILGRNLDLLVLVEYLTSKKQLDAIGGAYYATTLTNSVVSSHHLTDHARQIVEKYLKREQIRIGAALYHSGQDEGSDVFEVIEQTEKELAALTQSLNSKEVQRVDAVCVEILQELEKLRHRVDWLTGVTSGYRSLDKVFMGWQDSDLIILAARPAVGKTAFALRLAANPASVNIPTAFFSLEMSARQLVKRILSAEAKIYLSTLRSAKLDDDQMQHLYVHGIQKVAGMELYIDDTASITVAQIKSKLRKLKKKGVRLAVIDYLQLIKPTTGKNANRQQQIGDISRELKIAAKELEMPIIALSQLSREIEKRKSPVPQLSDLREAGDIEQDADIVMFLYGHGEEAVREDITKDGEIFLKIAKHRNGALETVQFRFDKVYQRFEDVGPGEIKIAGFKKLEENPF